MTLDDSMVDLKVAVDNACATIDILRARLARRDALLREAYAELKNFSPQMDSWLVRVDEELGDSHE